MDEPRGPLAPSVYRRRRIVATAGTAIGAVLFVWAIGALLGGNEPPEARNAANVGAGGPPATTGAPASNPPTSGRLPIQGSTTASPSASTPQPSIAQPPTTPGPTPVTTTTPPPPGPPQACPDAVIRVTVTSAQPVYQVGQHPLLTLHITNDGPVPCVRDVSHQFRSITVLSANGVTRLWSSADCYSVTTDEIRTLAPNQPLSYGVAWAGRTSAPGCPANRATVPPGQYELVGRLGNLAGPPTPLTLS